MILTIGRERKGKAYDGKVERRDGEGMEGKWPWVKGRPHCFLTY